MQLTKPEKNIFHYSGSNTSVRRSADGWYYVIYYDTTNDGKNNARPNGTYCYKVAPDNSRAEWVNLPTFIKSRVDVDVAPDGLFISAAINDDKDVVRYKVPGFITPAYPGGTQSFPPAPTIVTATDVLARAGIDTLRAETASNARNLEKRIKALADSVSSILSRPSDLTGLTAEMVRKVEEIAWAKAGDRLYADLKDHQSPTVNLIRQLVTTIVNRLLGRA